MSHFCLSTLQPQQSNIQNGITVIKQLGSPLLLYRKRLYINVIYRASRLVDCIVNTGERSSSLVAFVVQEQGQQDWQLVLYRRKVIKFYSLHVLYRRKVIKFGSLCCIGKRASGSIACVVQEKGHTIWQLVLQIQEKGHQVWQPVLHQNKGIRIGRLQVTCVVQGKGIKFGNLCCMGKRSSGLVACIANIEKGHQAW